LAVLPHAFEYVTVKTNEELMDVTTLCEMRSNETRLNEKQLDEMTPNESLLNETLLNEMLLNAS
jgi:hypothetical protein